MKISLCGHTEYLVKPMQTNIFDYLDESEDKEIDCTVRISKPIRFGEYKRTLKHFTSLKEKNDYLSKLDIAIHRKSKFRENYENVMLNE